MGSVGRFAALRFLPSILLLANAMWGGPVRAEFVDVGGYQLECWDRGTGEPVVVFLSGGSATMNYWDEVVASVAESARTITYERAGHQGSGMGREPRHGLNIVRELRALLAALDVPAPYVVVAHSAGCMYARILVQEHPADIAGMILLDPGDKDVLDAFGLDHLEGDVRAEWRAFWDGTWARLAERPGGFGQEIRYKEETLARMLDADFPHDLPLVVVSGLDRSRAQGYLAGFGDEVIDAFYAYIREYHCSLVSDMTRGRHVPAENAGHVIHQDQPELVIELIEEMLEVGACQEN
ncbi:MAG: alpha/beta hydrolase [bacterium]|nr:alpha/beta hydrolase [bacterium]